MMVTGTALMEAMRRGTIARWGVMAINLDATMASEYFSGNSNDNCGEIIMTTLLLLVSIYIGTITNMIVILRAIKLPNWILTYSNYH